MNKQGTYTYIAASLAFLVPFPGRFVYGIVFVLELLFLMLIGTCVSSVASKIRLGEIKNVLCLVALTAFSILFKHILILTQTEIAMTLGFLLFIPTVSSFIIGYLYNKQEETLLQRLKYNMRSTVTFSIFALFFFLFRDVFGYGTFTFFGKNHIIFEKVLFDSDRISVLSFFASMPGALLLVAVILFIELTVSKKLDIVGKTHIIENTTDTENTEEHK